MSTRQAALRTEAAASTAPVTASPRGPGYPLGHPHGQLSHLRADLGDLQRHDRRAQERLPRLPALAVLPRQADRLEHGV